MKTSISNTLSPSPGCDKPVRLRVKHSTCYRYAFPVVLSYNQGWLQPRSDAWQACVSHRLRVEPKPRFQSEQVDLFGNKVHYFELLASHDVFRVVSESVVIVKPADYAQRGQQAWEKACFLALPPGLIRTQASYYAAPTAMTTPTGEMLEYARISFTPERPLREAVEELCHRIFTDFRYQGGVTGIDTPLTTIWESRKGVCQDFAHLALAMLRGLGLVAAYVSGYILTRPLAGQPRLQGADASHAWFGVLDENGEWLYLDPTNDKWVQTEHIRVALGRDYGDVPPLKGISYGGGAVSPEVAVDVERLGEEET
ncbi:MAG: transglutaminase family protein [Hahellaceae bacterium]|nr:transglutaminase family protein [Hahellaceae bacterium]